MSESKTGRKAAQAAAAMNQSAKKVISDEQYVKNLRDDLANARYVAQEGARALLRVYDVAVSELALAIKANEGLAERNADLTTNLDASRARVLELEAAQTQNAELAKSAPYADQLQPHPITGEPL